MESKLLNYESIFFCVLQKIKIKCVQVRNDKRVSIFERIFIFGWTIPLMANIFLAKFILRKVY